MTRLIDADRLRNIAISNRDMEMVYEIDQSPTIASPKWIPIEERLPESAGFYLITFKSSMGNYIVCEMCYRKNEDNWSENGVKPVCLRNEEILAWMPLPKPYKKEGKKK